MAFYDEFSNQILLHLGIDVMCDWFLEHYRALIIVDVVDLAYWVLVCLCWAGCRCFLVPQNSLQTWDLKWSKSIGTWASALLMCPRGPKHYRVGWAGSQSYFYLLIVVPCVLMLVVLVRLLCVVAWVACVVSLSCCDVEYNVFITLVHTHTHTQKKLHLLWEVVVVTNRPGSLQKLTLSRGWEHEMQYSSQILERSL